MCELHRAAIASATAADDHLESARITGAGEGLSRSRGCNATVSGGESHRCQGLRLKLRNRKDNQAVDIRDACALLIRCHSRHSVGLGLPRVHRGGRVEAERRMHSVQIFLDIGGVVADPAAQVHRVERCRADTAVARRNGINDIRIKLQRLRFVKYSSNALNTLHRANYTTFHLFPMMKRTAQRWVSAK